MPSWFIVSIFFAILTFIAFRIRNGAKDNLVKVKAKLENTNNDGGSSYRGANYEGAKRDVTNATATYGGLIIATWVLLGLTALTLLASIAYIVPVRNVGIVTTFNNPSGRTTGSGLKFVLPWQKIADFDASIQNADHTGDHCTTVRIGSLATACVENRIQWQVLESAAPRLYKDYKGDFNNLKTNLVETKIQNALNAVFATYNPLSQVNISTGQTTFDGAKLSNDLKTELDRTIGSDIKILTVTVPLVHHDAKTEDNIKAFQDVIAKARILEQQLSNAQKEKAIADLQQQYLTTEFVANKCIEESVKMGVPPGLCLVGGQAIVDTRTQK